MPPPVGGGGDGPKKPDPRHLHLVPDSQPDTDTPSGEGAPAPAEPHPDTYLPPRIQAYQLLPSNVSPIGSRRASEGIISRLLDEGSMVTQRMPNSSPQADPNSPLEWYRSIADRISARAARAALAPSEPPAALPPTLYRWIQQEGLLSLDKKPEAKSVTKIGKALTAALKSAFEESESVADWQQLKAKLKEKTPHEVDASGNQFYETINPYASADSTSGTSLVLRLEASTGRVSVAISNPKTPSLQTLSYDDDIPTILHNKRQIPIFYDGNGGISTLTVELSEKRPYAGTRRKLQEIYARIQASAPRSEAISASASVPETVYDWMASLGKIHLQPDYDNDGSFPNSMLYAWQLTFNQSSSTFASVQDIHRLFQSRPGNIATDEQGNRYFVRVNDNVSDNSALVIRINLAGEIHALRLNNQDTQPLLAASSTQEMTAHVSSLPFPERPVPTFEYAGNSYPIFGELDGYFAILNKDATVETRLHPKNIRGHIAAYADYKKIAGTTRAAIERSISQDESDYRSSLEKPASGEADLGTALDRTQPAQSPATIFGWIANEETISLDPTGAEADSAHLARKMLEYWRTRFRDDSPKIATVADIHGFFISQPQNVLTDRQGNQYFIRIRGDFSNGPAIVIRRNTAGELHAVRLPQEFVQKKIKSKFRGDIIAVVNKLDFPKKPVPTFTYGAGSYPIFGDLNGYFTLMTKTFVEYEVGGEIIEEHIEAYEEAKNKYERDFQTADRVEAMLLARRGINLPDRLADAALTPAILRPATLFDRLSELGEIDATIPLDIASRDFRDQVRMEVVSWVADMLRSGRPPITSRMLVERLDLDKGSEPPKHGTDAAGNRYFFIPSEPIFAVKLTPAGKIHALIVPTGEQTEIEDLPFPSLPVPMMVHRGDAIPLFPSIDGGFVMIVGLNNEISHPSVGMIAKLSAAADLPQVTATGRVNTGQRDVPVPETFYQWMVAQKTIDLDQTFTGDKGAFPRVILDRWKEDFNENDDIMATYADVAKLYNEKTDFVISDAANNRYFISKGLSTLVIKRTPLGAMYAIRLDNDRAQVDALLKMEKKERAAEFAQLKFPADPVPTIKFKGRNYPAFPHALGHLVILHKKGGAEISLSEDRVTIDTAIYAKYRETSVGTTAPELAPASSQQGSLPENLYDWMSQEGRFDFAQRHGKDYKSDLTNKIFKIYRWLLRDNRKDRPANLAEVIAALQRIKPAAVEGEIKYYTITNPATTWIYIVTPPNGLSVYHLPKSDPRAANPFKGVEDLSAAYPARPVPLLIDGDTVIPVLPSPHAILLHQVPRDAPFNFSTAQMKEPAANDFKVLQSDYSKYRAAMRSRPPAKAPVKTDSPSIPSVYQLMEFMGEINLDHLDQNEGLQGAFATAMQPEFGNNLQYAMDADHLIAMIRAMAADPDKYLKIDSKGNRYLFFYNPGSEDKALIVRLSPKGVLHSARLEGADLTRYSEDSHYSEKSTPLVVCGGKRIPVFPTENGSFLILHSQKPTTFIFPEVDKRLFALHAQVRESLSANKDAPEPELAPDNSPAYDWLLNQEPIDADYREVAEPTNAEEYVLHNIAKPLLASLGDDGTIPFYDTEGMLKVLRDRAAEKSDSPYLFFSDYGYENGIAVKVVGDEIYATYVRDGAEPVFPERPVPKVKSGDKLYPLMPVEDGGVGFTEIEKDGLRLPSGTLDLQPVFANREAIFKRRRKNPLAFYDAIQAASPLKVKKSPETPLDYFVAYKLAGLFSSALAQAPTVEELIGAYSGRGVVTIDRKNGLTFYVENRKLYAGILGDAPALVPIIHLHGRNYPIFLYPGNGDVIGFLWKKVGPDSTVVFQGLRDEFLNSEARFRQYRLDSGKIAEVDSVGRDFMEFEATQQSQYLSATLTIGRNAQLNNQSFDFDLNGLKSTIRFQLHEDTTYRDFKSARTVSSAASATITWGTGGQPIHYSVTRNKQDYDLKPLPNQGIAATETIRLVHVEGTGPQLDLEQAPAHRTGLVQAVSIGHLEVSITPSQNGGGGEVRITLPEGPAAEAVQEILAENRPVTMQYENHRKAFVAQFRLHESPQIAELLRQTLEIHKASIEERRKLLNQTNAGWPPKPTITVQTVRGQIDGKPDVFSLEFSVRENPVTHERDLTQARLIADSEVADALDLKAESLLPVTQFPVQWSGEFELEFRKGLRFKVNAEQSEAPQVSRPIPDSDIALGSSEGKLSIAGIADIAELEAPLRQRRDGRYIVEGANRDRLLAWHRIIGKAIDFDPKTHSDLEVLIESDASANPPYRLIGFQGATLPPDKKEPKPPVVRSVTVPVQLNGRPDSFTLQLKIQENPETQERVILGATAILDPSVQRTLKIDALPLLETSLSIPLEAKTEIQFKGDLRFTLETGLTGEISATRHAPSSELAVDPDPSSKWLHLTGVTELALLQAPLQKEDGTAATYSVSLGALEQILAWMNFVGIESGFERGTHTDLGMRIQRKADGSYEILGFRGFTRNTDGSVPVHSIPVSEEQMLAYADAIAAARGKEMPAAGSNLQVGTGEVKSPLFTFHIQDIEPGEVFYMSAATIQQMVDLRKQFPAGSGNIPQGHPLTVVLESKSGFALEVPVTWTNSRANPLKLDNKGRVKRDADGNIVLNDDGSPQIEGRVIRARLQPGDTWMPFDESLRVHEERGFWKFYVLRALTETNVKVFNLAALPHPDAKLLVSMVNTLDENGDDSDEAIHRANAREAADWHYQQVLKANSSQWGQIIPLGGREIELPPAEAATQSDKIIFVSERFAGQQVSAKLEGFKLNTAHQTLDLEPQLTLTVTVEELGKAHSKEIIRVEHRDGAKPNIILLTEIGSAGNPRKYEWNRRRNTLRRTDGDIKGKPTELSDLLFKEGLALKRQKSPATESADPKDAPVKPVPPGVGGVLIIPQEIGELESEDRDLSIADANVTLLNDRTATAEEIRKLKLHSQAFIPDESSIHAQAENGRATERMRFISPTSGAVFEIPMQLEAAAPHRYLADETDPDPTSSVQGARILIPRSDKPGFYFEVPLSVAHPRVAGGRNQQSIEVHIDSADGNEGFNFTLHQTANSETNSNRDVFGWVAIDETQRKNGVATARYLNNGRALVRSAVHFFGLNRAPQWLSKPAPGADIVTLTNGQGTGRRELEISLSALTDRTYQLSVPDLSEPVFVGHTNEDGNEDLLHLTRAPRGGSLLYLHDLESERRSYLKVTQQGEVAVSQRPQNVKDFYIHPSSIDFPMKAIDGEDYASGARSVATRKLIPNEATGKTEYEINALLGRWKGAAASDIRFDASSDIQRIRFLVTEEGDTLVPRFKGLDKDEQAAGIRLSTGENDTIRITEDKWTDANGTEHRGRVRVVFKQEKPDATTQSYGWLSFENREAILGSAEKFKVEEVHAHVAKRPGKILPTDAGFLTERAGVKVDLEVLQTIKSGFEALEESVRVLWEPQLAQTQARASDAPILIGALELLGKVTPQKTYAEADLRAMAAFAKTFNPAPTTPSGTRNPKRFSYLIGSKDQTGTDARPATGTRSLKVHATLRRHAPYAHAAHTQARLRTLRQIRANGLRRAAVARSAVLMQRTAMMSRASTVSSAMRFIRAR